VEVIGAGAADAQRVPSGLLRGADAATDNPLSLRAAQQQPQPPQQQQQPRRGQAPIGVQVSAVVHRPHKPHKPPLTSRAPSAEGSLGDVDAGSSVVDDSGEPPRTHAEAMPSVEDTV
jgi:hypothetical protein